MRHLLYDHVTSVCLVQLSFLSARAGVSLATFSALTWTVGFVRTEITSCIHIYRIPLRTLLDSQGRGCAAYHLYLFFFYIVLYDSILWEEARDGHENHKTSCEHHCLQLLLPQQGCLTL